MNNFLDTKTIKLSILLNHKALRFVIKQNRKFDSFLYSFPLQVLPVLIFRIKFFLSKLSLCF